MTPRVRAIGRAELTLLWRNRTAMVNAVLLPVGAVALVAAVNAGDAIERADNATFVTGLLGLILLSVVYYNLVSTYVARREELVLKRLRTGEVTDAEILAGTASPTVVIAVAQVVLCVGVGAALVGLPVPVNVPVLVLGVLAGVVVFVLLAAASATFTHTVEMAQVTTLPVLLLCTVGSGIVVPTQMLPEPIAAVLRFLPLTPAVDLMRLGWLGTTGDGTPADFAGVFGPAAVPAAILAAWAAVGVAAVRRWFRWAPRR
ncbi:ABC transporter permease [Phytohabitans rumicis]|uniref:Transport permease protein n=1 Tax=Phytohabitans rumicis TaxID=1076125 RepID=A0A6V8KSP0_9ACTN|nr:ABC transporter permease [Phytohabitans rumicis]GFJ86440.1 transport permease protein [Phytohabitans rumicis]